MVVVVVPIGFRYQSGRFAGGGVVPHPSQARNRLCRHAVFSTAKFGGLDTIWGSGGFPSPRP